MKLIRDTACFLIMGILICSGVNPKGFKTLAIGDQAPDFNLLGVDGKTYSLSDFSSSDILMIYFTGTHCPTSNGVEARVQQLVSDMASESFQLVAINPNNDSGMRMDEYSYSRYTESFEDSKRYAKDLGWTFPFLYNGDKQDVAKAYGCLATPHVFIFDKKRKLRYQGRYDDSRFPDPKTVKRHDARNAVEALLAGKKVSVEKTRPFGCSTKWKEKKQSVEKSNADWNALPAVTEEIDLAGVEKLVKNGSGKVRLINFWATYCPPCINKLPDIAALNRRFSNRKFELITISQDEPKEKEQVEKMLSAKNIATGKKQQNSLLKEGRRTNNYIYTETDYEALASAVDPEWAGPIPYTILVNNDGEILYRCTSGIDSQKVIDLVLEELTTYWDSSKFKAKK